MCRGHCIIMHMFGTASSMCSDVFCIVCSFVMHVVDEIGEHMMEVYFSVGLNKNTLTIVIRDADINHFTQ